MATLIYMQQMIQKWEWYIFIFVYKKFSEYIDKYFCKVYHYTINFNKAKFINIKSGGVAHLYKAIKI